ncbi:MAG TPA: DUF2752 domain-containing protein [Candidatus Binatia bacterium]|nr:DUF2752 domain-containing protein [Candidatus Binatia bacterium]
MDSLPPARRAHPGLAAGVAAALIALRDPHRPIGPLRRPVKLVTGLDCPGCGGLRMAHDLLHGDLRAAARDNPFLLAAGPILGLSLLRPSTGARGLAMRRDLPPRVAFTVAAMAVAWTVLRNLPGWPLKPSTA